MSVSVYAVCGCPSMGEEGVRSTRTGATGGCTGATQCGYWELNSSPLEKQQVLVTVEQSLQAIYLIFWQSLYCHRICRLNVKVVSEYFAVVPDFVLGTFSHWSFLVSGPLPWFLEMWWLVQRSKCLFRLSFDYLKDYKVFALLKVRHVSRTFLLPHFRHRLYRSPRVRARTERAVEGPCSVSGGSHAAADSQHRNHGR